MRLTRIGHAVLFMGALLACGCSTRTVLDSGVEVSSLAVFKGTRTHTDYFNSIYYVHLRLPEGTKTVSFRAWPSFRVGDTNKDTTVIVKDGSGRRLRSQVVEARSLYENVVGHRNFGPGGDGYRFQVGVPEGGRVVTVWDGTTNGRGINISHIEVSTTVAATLGRGGPRQERTPGSSTPQPSVRVSCDVRFVAVADGSVVPGGASGTGRPGELDALAQSLAAQLGTANAAKGQPVAVVSLRNRSKTELCRESAEILSDKLTTALADTRRFDVKERIDLRTLVDEKRLEQAGIVKNEAVRKMLSGVKYIVIGGVTVTSKSLP